MTKIKSQIVWQSLVHYQRNYEMYWNRNKCKQFKKRYAQCGYHNAFSVRFGYCLQSVLRKIFVQYNIFVFQCSGYSILNSILLFFSNHYILDKRGYWWSFSWIWLRLALFKVRLALMVYLFSLVSLHKSYFVHLLAI